MFGQWSDLKVATVGVWTVVRFEGSWTKLKMILKVVVVRMMVRPTFVKLTQHLRTSKT